MRVPLLVLTVTLCCASLAMAQGNPPPAPPAVETQPPIFAPGKGAAGAKQPPLRGSPPRASSKAGPRTISPETTARITKMVNRELPPPKKWAVAEAGPAATSTADPIDAVLLDPFVVQEDKLPDWKERHMLSPEGKLELARKRHPGLNLVPFLNNAAAKDIIEDEFQKERNKEMKELYGIQRMSTPPSRDVKKKVDEAMSR